MITKNSTARSERLFTVKNVYTVPHELELLFLLVVMSVFPLFSLSGI